jgi:hypothetical protein
MVVILRVQAQDLHDLRLQGLERLTGPGLPPGLDEDPPMGLSVVAEHGVDGLA